MPPIPNAASSTALILAPLGRDATIAAELLSEAALPSAICSDIEAFSASLNENASFAVIAEEVLHSADLRGLIKWLEDQPPWSDLPILVLTRHSDPAALSSDTQRSCALLGNVTLIERPFHPLTFISTARAAHKGRVRQYEARARIRELRESEESLERRIAERTVELKEAHAAILAEMAQREKAEEKLRQSQKMEMIGQLTGGVAHDFNNLLMAVIGNLDLLSKRVPTDATALKLIEGAVHGAQRGAALTQRLLAFARRQDLKIEPTNLADLLHGMKELIVRSIGGQIELAIEVARELPLVMADANQVELAILNLAINARDAMPNGGQITIRLKQVGAESAVGLPPGSYVCLAVEDTGFGMDSETLNKATEPFFSTKEVGKGTGLGLSMIHGLTRQLGGTLRLHSSVGIGTTAEIWMPATTKPIVASSPSGTAATEPVPADLTILVVDDDVLISMSTAMMVEDLGHKVVEVNSGVAALDVLKSGQKVDLIITDFSMPKMNGEQLAKAAKAMYPDLPILLATGYAELPGGLELGLHRISKPYQQDQLAAALAAVLRSRCDAGF